MSAELVTGSPFAALLAGRGLSEAGAATDPEVSHAIRAVFAALACAVEARRATEGG